MAEAIRNSALRITADAGGYLYRPQILHIHLFLLVAVNLFANRVLFKELGGAVGLS
jgi:hypothetical protein